jgi:hypothetical protein
MIIVTPTSRLTLTLTLTRLISLQLSLSPTSDWPERRSVGSSSRGSDESNGEVASGLGLRTWLGLGLRNKIQTNLNPNSNPILIIDIDFILKS